MHSPSTCICRWPKFYHSNRCTMVSPCGPDLLSRNSGVISFYLLAMLPFLKCLVLFVSPFTSLLVTLVYNTHVSRVHIFLLLYTLQHALTIQYLFFYPYVTCLLNFACAVYWSSRSLTYQSFILWLGSIFSLQSKKHNHPHFLLKVLKFCFQHTSSNSSKVDFFTIQYKVSINFHFPYM